jgi:hypothetical protein
LEGEDDVECEDDYGEDFLNSLDLENDCRLPILSDSYRQPISQIRKISKIFRKSPVRDSILQNYIKQEKEKELVLLICGMKLIIPKSLAS